MSPIDPTRAPRSRSRLLVAVVVVATTLAAGLVGPAAPAHAAPSPVPSITDCTISFTPSTLGPDQPSTVSITSTSGVGGAIGVGSPGEGIAIPLIGEYEWADMYAVYGAGPFTLSVWALNTVLPIGPLDKVCEATLTVLGPAGPTFVTDAALPVATVGVPFAQPLLAEPGSEFTTVTGCTVTGAMPPGISLTPAGGPGPDEIDCGTLTGTPTTAGTSTLTATLTYRIEASAPCGTEGADSGDGAAVCGLDEAETLTVTRDFTLTVVDAATDAATAVPRFTG